MAYVATIPQAANKLSSSQVSILANFQAINTWTGIDHVGFNIVNQGTHKRVFFNQLVADPITNATQAALYLKAGTGGSTSIFYRPPSNGTPIEFSYSNNASPGYTILPSGIYIQWGTGNVGNNAAVPFNIAFPNACLNVQLTSIQTGFQQNFIKVVGAPAVNQFVARSETTTGNPEVSSFYYFAIGY